MSDERSRSSIRPSQSHRGVPLPSGVHIHRMIFERIEHFPVSHFLPHGSENRVRQHIRYPIEIKKIIFSKQKAQNIGVVVSYSIKERATHPFSETALKKIYVLNRERKLHRSSNDL